MCVQCSYRHKTITAWCLNIALWCFHWDVPLVGDDNESWLYFTESSCHDCILFWFFFFLWNACGNKGEKLFEEHSQNRSCEITMLLRNGQTFQHIFILFCQYYFIQARSAALNIVLWRMWKNSFKNVPGQGSAYVLTKVCGGFITFCFHFCRHSLSTATNLRKKILS